MKGDTITTFKETKCADIKAISVYPKIFTFAYAQKIDGELRQRSNWKSCRELFISDFFSSVPKAFNPKDYAMVIFHSLDKFNYKTVDGKKILDEEATHVATSKRREKVIKNVTRILNMVEKTAGWASSKVLALENSNSYMRRGGFPLIINYNPKWFTSTQLLSLLCLIVRLATTSELPSIVKSSNFNDLTEAVSKFIDKGINKDSVGDLGHFVRTQHLWIPIMLAYKSVFGDSVDRTNMRVDQTKGIDSFLRGNAQKGIMGKWQAVEKKMTARATARIQKLLTTTNAE